MSMSQIWLSAYGQAQQIAFKDAFEANGGAVTTSLAHEDGKVDYAEESAALSEAGGELLVVLGYYDQGVVLSSGHR